ncbi:MAG: endonuclease/exonuclease/phosphatase family protein [Chlamydiales bacterium]|nr:endonuclease/exonuclease/phosphatase family protein [Chlamydiales bacterium]
MSEPIPAALPVTFNPMLISWNDQVGQALSWVALKLQWGMHYSSEQVLHAYSAILPGEFGNFESEEIEMLVRVARVALTVLFAPLTLALTFCGVALELVANCFKSSPCTYIKGESEGEAPKNKYRLLTLNACMFWGGLPIPFGGVRPASERVEQVADFLKYMNSDLVVMQEVSFGPARALIEKLKGDYAHFYTQIGPNTGRMESCLFLASKQPILREPIFVEFPDQNGIKRGFFCVETPKSWVITTHMEAGNNPEMRRAQLALITQKIPELKQLSNKPCFLLGDLNIHRTLDVGSEYLASGLQENYFNPLTQPEDHDTCTDLHTARVMGRERPVPSGQAVDYALVDERSLAEHPLNLSARLVNTLDISDHYSIILEVEHN